ncbi:MAG TPA: hypothetical protein VFT99_08535, partial [Roseiflexaceae bacterium]|nr:hypothetical protein [Roseiflexaceae bacterium]
MMEVIYQTAMRVVEASYFCISLNDNSHNCLVLASLVTNGKSLPTGAVLPAHVGLSNVILRQRSPLIAGDYLRECQRLGVEPTTSIGIPAPCVWL